MSRTFEEIAVREIDGLYQEALFLSGGSEEVAEELLLRTLARSYRAFGERESDRAPGPWLEGRLAKDFLRASADEHPLRAGWEGPYGDLDVSGDPPAPGTLDSGVLHRAAAKIPAGARAVLWLVLFGRWPYEDVERLLEVERSVVRDLMRYRHVLLKEVLGAGWARSSPDASEAS